MMMKIMKRKKCKQFALSTMALVLTSFSYTVEKVVAHAYDFPDVSYRPILIH